MRAVVYTRFGPPEVLQLQEIEKPVPKNKEVLIKIHATTVTSEDPKLRELIFPPLLWFPIRIVMGFRTPKKPILGFELAGEVESIGRNVTRFKVGDHVVGYTGLSFGAYAEYKCMPEDGVLGFKPENMSFGEAAATPNGALTSLVFLRNKAKIQRGEKVLIYGASGAVGTAAVQIAKYYGAEVTAVCSFRNLDLVKSLGADNVIDYTQEDFTQNGERYDIIFDAVGKTSIPRTKKSLKPGGRYLLTEFGLAGIFEQLRTTLFGDKRVMSAASNFHWKAEDLSFLKEMIEAGQLKTVIDRCYPLEQVVEAHKYVEKGRKRGNVVLTLSDGSGN